MPVLRAIFVKHPVTMERLAKIVCTSADIALTETRATRRMERVRIVRQGGVVNYVTEEQSVELIVGSSAGLLVFVASVAVAVFLIRKSRKRKDTSKTEDKTNTSDLTNVNQERNGVRPRL
uniref:Uncharacterized protein n=1 Tax=Magallana gigas TaxID=29159 RepID=A0A8W8NWC1_MAGGI